MKTKPHILVADDEPDLTDIMTAVLDQRGFATSSAFDGVQVLESVHERPPDLILLDLDMPRLNGWQVIERLKQDEALSSIRIVILTGVAKSEQERHASLARRADAYLLKPCAPDEVVRTIQTVLDHA
jgi:DNA-binding response OmpR family regulator